MATQRGIQRNTVMIIDGHPLFRQGLRRLNSHGECRLLE
jgi:hypothetical protein